MEEVLIDVKDFTFIAFFPPLQMFYVSTSCRGLSKPPPSLQRSGKEKRIFRITIRNFSVFFQEDFKLFWKISGPFSHLFLHIFPSATSPPKPGGVRAAEGHRSLWDLRRHYHIHLFINGAAISSWCLKPPWTFYERAKEIRSFLKDKYLLLPSLFLSSISSLPSQIRFLLCKLVVIKNMKVSPSDSDLRVFILEIPR